MENERLVIMVTEHGQRIEQCEGRIKSLESNSKDIQNLAMSIQELAISVKAMAEEQKDQGERIEALEKEPADNWKALKNTIISLIVGAIFSGILTYLFTK